MSNNSTRRYGWTPDLPSIQDLKYKVPCKISTVPLPEIPGSTQVSGSTGCSGADDSCIVTWELGGVKKLFGGDVKKDGECIGNCHCLEEEWITAVHTKCKTQGDCGAYYNIIGKFTEEGFYYDTPAKPKFKNWNTLATQPEDCTGMSTEDQKGKNCEESENTIKNFFKKSAIPLVALGGVAIFSLVKGGGTSSMKDNLNPLGLFGCAGSKLGIGSKT